jgi:DivIVA domain-containing protein
MSSFFSSDSPSTPVTAAELRATTLRTTSWREGYEKAEVDALLARAALALEDKAYGRVPSLTAEQVLNAKFKPTKFRAGYDQDTVDDLLDRVVSSLR